MRTAIRQQTQLFNKPATSGREPEWGRKLCLSRLILPKPTCSKPTFLAARGFVSAVTLFTRGDGPDFRPF